MKLRIVGLLAIAAFAVIPDQSRAADLTPLVRFNGTDGANPGFGSLIADANGNLFGTTERGGASDLGDWLTNLGRKCKECFVTTWRYDNCQSV